MIDKNSLPYIDLGADTEILRKYALDHFGKKISTNYKPETVAERFREIYKEETGIELQQVAAITDDPDVDNDDDVQGESPDEVHDDLPEVKKKPAKLVKQKRIPTHATIILQDDPTDPGDVKVGAQFVSYLIKRNVEVRVPIAVLNALKDAKQTLYNPKDMTSKEVLAYPFSVMEYHYED